MGLLFDAAETWHFSSLKSLDNYEDHCLSTFDGLRWLTAVARSDAGGDGFETNSAGL
jgi:hypothetical protein